MKKFFQAFFFSALASSQVQAQAGSLDLSFDTDGKVTTALGNSQEYGFYTTIQPDGKILVAGYSNNASNKDFAVVRYNTNGSLDTSFDTDGKVTTPVGGSDDIACSIALQPDGKIVVGGYTFNGSNYNFAVVRYNTDGSLDTSFDTDGKVTTVIGTGNDVGYSVALQADGKIILAGYTTGANIDFAVVRYNANGSLDTSFDTDGKVITPVGTTNDYGRSAAIQADGKIVVGGYISNGASYNFAVVRYNTDGSLDTAFDTDGKVTTAIGTTSLANYLVIQTDGKILLAGYSAGTTNDFAVARYNTNGSLDTSFDTDGKATTDIGGYDDVVNSLVLQSDGKIVVAGESGNGTSDDFALVRYNTNGSLDATFDTDGKVTTPVGATTNDGAYSVALQSDGKIVAAGFVWNGSNNDIAVVRYIVACNVTIPDANFKAYLVGNSAINTNADTEIQCTEAAAFTGAINCYFLNISDLTGIEAFPNITQLWCQQNQLTSLNLSSNTALANLDVQQNQLTSLNISANTALTTLQCHTNQLTNLDVNTNINLTYLSCNSNQLTSLNISNNTALTSLECQFNQLTTLDVSNNTALTSLRCQSNQLTSLNISTNTALTYLYCNNNQLSSLNVSTNTNLYYLDCGSNTITSLNLNNNTALAGLNCNINQLTNLNLNVNTAITQLWCINNQLTTLDLSNQTGLINLYANNNLFTSLNIKNGNNTNLLNPEFTNNPNLTCIEVDDTTYANANFTSKDATAHYSTNCLASFCPNS